MKNLHKQMTKVHLETVKFDREGWDALSVGLRALTNVETLTMKNVLVEDSSGEPFGDFLVKDNLLLNILEHNQCIETYVTLRKQEEQELPTRSK